MQHYYTTEVELYGHLYTQWCKNNKSIATTPTLVTFYLNNFAPKGKLVSMCAFDTKRYMFVFLVEE